MRGAGAAAAPVAGPPLTTAEPPVAPAAPTPPVPAPGSVLPPALPAATRFVAPAGSDAGTCTAPAPCRSLDRAYHVAVPGEVVEVAGGAYGAQTITPDPGKAGTGCATAARLAACVAFTPAAGATVTMPSLAVGATYGVPGRPAWPSSPPPTGGCGRAS